MMRYSLAISNAVIDLFVIAETLLGKTSKMLYTILGVVTDVITNEHTVHISAEFRTEILCIQSSLSTEFLYGTQGWIKSLPQWVLTVRKILAPPGTWHLAPSRGC